MNRQKNIIIIGASSAIAEHCARIWLKSESVSLTLVGRNLEKIEQITIDLRIRSPQSTIQSHVANFIDPESIEALVNNICSEKAIDLVLIAHGSLPVQLLCQESLIKTCDALLINGISPVLFAEAFAANMEKANHGTLAIISSVAGERGRKSNYIYGAAKGLISRYVQGLQHRLYKTNVNVVLIKPGPTDTPMTAHLKNRESLAPVEKVAQVIVDGINKGKATVYAPGKWALIMLIIRGLPDFIFNKLEI